MTATPVKNGIARPALGFMLDCRGLFRPPGDVKLQSNAFSRAAFRLAVLVLCGGVLFAAVSACHRAPAADVAATVNGKDIQRSEISKRRRQTRTFLQPENPRLSREY